MPRRPLPGDGAPSPYQNLPRARELTLRETFDLCRQCHKLAPFCFYNGNTFVAIGRTLILDLLWKMSPVKGTDFGAWSATTSQAQPAQRNCAKRSTRLNDF